MPKKALKKTGARKKSVTKTPKRPARAKAAASARAPKRTIRVLKKVRAKSVSAKKSVKPRTAKSSAKAAQPLPKAPVVKGPDRRFVDANELPLNYDTTRLALLARDPHWIYAYWEISPQAQNTLKYKLGPAFSKATYVLRVHDITESGRGASGKGRFFDIPVKPPEQSRYIELPGDNACYRAELFARSSSGKYFPLARSNCVSTPNAEVSQSTGQTWMKVEYGEGVQPKIVETVRSNDAVPVEFFDGKPIQPAEIPAIPISGPEAQNVELSSTIDAGLGEPKSLANRSTRKSRSADGGFEAFEPRGFAIGHPAHPLGSSENLGARIGGAFSIETELIVRGRAEAGAQVWLNDDSIPLTSDGTFYLQFDLTEGVVPLAFRAISSGQSDCKTISTSVVRTPTSVQ